jgi:hypothetical protein
VNSNLEVMSSQRASWKTSSKATSVVLALMIGFVLLDTSLLRISDFTINQLSLKDKTTIFAFTSVICLAAQYFVLNYVRKSAYLKKGAAKRYLELISTMVIMVQGGLAAVSLYVVFQVLVLAHYQVLSLVLVMTLSYALSIVQLAFLSQRFFSWFRIKRDSVVLVYGISTAILAINGVFTLVLVVDILLDKPATILPNRQITFPISQYGPITGIFNSIFFVSSLAAFLFTWAATALLLRHYSRRIGRIKYWLVLIAPLAFFLSQFITLSFDLLSPLIRADPVFFGVLLTVAFTFSKPIGGILFGIAFWTLTKNIRSQSIVRDYMNIAAFGLILMFVVNQSLVLSATAYPPFGLVTVSLMGLSSYLVFVGIYSSAISISEDTRLRTAIRKVALEQSKLLDSIGFAQMEEEIKKKVFKIVKTNSEFLLPESGIPSSLDELEAKDYINEVMEELRDLKIAKKEKGKRPSTQ